jgi:ceramide glucosyltransferase
MTVLLVVEGYLLFILAVYFFLILLGHLLTWRYFSTYQDSLPEGVFRPRVSIIKPVKGLDQGMFENLASFCEFNYANDYEILFCVEDRDDPAIPVIESVMASFPDRATKLVFSEAHPAWMGKATNLIYGVQSSKYDVLVFSDTDTRAPQQFLSHLVQPLGNPDTGMVYACPAYQGARDLGAALMAQSVNSGILYHAGMSVLGDFSGAIGTTMAVRRETLSEIGGLETLASQITTDTPLGRAITARGYRLHLADIAIPVILEHYSMLDWWRHNLRWNVIVRHYIPFSYALIPLLGWGVAHSLLYVLLSAATRHHMPLSGILLLAVILTKIVSTLAVNSTFAHEKSTWRYVWFTPLHELLGGLLWVRAYLTNVVVWRGLRYRLYPTSTSVQAREIEEERT